MRPRRGHDVALRRAHCLCVLAGPGVGHQVVDGSRRRLGVDLVLVEARWTSGKPWRRRPSRCCTSGVTSHRRPLLPRSCSAHTRQRGRSGRRQGCCPVMEELQSAVVPSGKDVTGAVRSPTWRFLGGWWRSTGVSAPSRGGVSRRVLMVGSDARPGERVEPSRGGTLHVVGFARHGGGGVLGFARPVYVSPGTEGQCKVNSALVSRRTIDARARCLFADRRDGYLL